MIAPKTTKTCRRHDEYRPLNCVKSNVSRQVSSFLLLGDLLLKFPQQGILRIFVNLRFVLDILRTVSVSVFIKEQ